MQKFLSGFRKKNAREPQLVFHESLQNPATATLTAITYTKTDLEEKSIQDAESLQLPSPKNGVFWLNVANTSDAETVKKIGIVFSLHPCS